MYTQYGKEDNRWPDSNANYYNYMKELGEYYSCLVSDGLGGGTGHTIIYSSEHRCFYRRFWLRSTIMSI